MKGKKGRKEVSWENGFVASFPYFKTLLKPSQSMI
jgi:hypothetical protein